MGYLFFSTQVTSRFVDIFKTNVKFTPKLCFLTIYNTSFNQLQAFKPFGF